MLTPREKDVIRRAVCGPDHQWRYEERTSAAWRACGAEHRLAGRLVDAADADLIVLRLDRFAHYARDYPRLLRGQRTPPGDDHAS